MHQSACMRGCVVTLFAFFSLSFLLLLLGVSNTKGVEIRVDISMCVCTKPKITFKLYLSVLGYLCKCRGGNRAVFPSDEFYLSIYFLLFVQRKNINPLVAECKGHKKVQFISSLSKGIGSTNSSVDRFSSIH